MEPSNDQDKSNAELSERRRTPYSYNVFNIGNTSRVEADSDFTSNTYGSRPQGAYSRSTGFSSGNSSHRNPMQDHPPSTDSTDGHTPRASASERSKRDTPSPRQCRICLDSVHPTFQESTIPSVPGLPPQRPRYVYEDAENGRLISPCKCKGSAKYVHEACLQQWRTVSHKSRNYLNCPTCGYSYRLERLTWAKYVQSWPSQMLLTFFVFIVAMFLIGFIADPIINLYLDPWSLIGWGWFVDNPLEPIDQIFDDEEAGGWIEHFFKGIAGLGVLGFLKFMLMSPFQFFRMRIGGGGANRGRNTGRDRMESLSWIVILVGISTTLYGIYTGVSAFSRRALVRAAERVLDVGGDEDNDDAY